VSPLEAAATYDAAGMPLVLWTPEALRYALATVRPPPPSKPRWVESADDWELMLGELKGCYSLTEAEVLL
jgi:hypothetical protein